MTTPIPPADEADWTLRMTEFAAEIWAGDDIVAQFVTRDDADWVIKQHNDWLAARTTHPPAQQAAGLAEARERVARLKNALANSRGCDLLLNITGSDQGARDLTLILAELDRLTRARDGERVQLETAARALTEAEITEWWGPRCDAFEPACFVCAAWARHDIMAAMSEEDERTRLHIERDRAALSTRPTPPDRGDKSAGRLEQPAASSGQSVSTPNEGAGAAVSPLTHRGDEGAFADALFDAYERNRCEGEDANNRQVMSLALKIAARSPSDAGGV